MLFSDFILSNAGCKGQLEACAWKGFRLPGNAADIFAKYKLTQLGYAANSDACDNFDVHGSSEGMSHITRTISGITSKIGR